MSGNSGTPPPADGLPAFALSSPFAASSFSDSRSTTALPVHLDDIFSSSAAATPPPSSPPPPPPSPSSSSFPSSSIRQPQPIPLHDDNATALQGSELRRPEYMKRSRRSLNEADPATFMEEEDRPIGIMETPIKGRRLKLFQETSDESFEESLMAGGYGRYRTAEWVRQPTPLSGSPFVGGSTVAKSEEPPEEVPLTEKEITKRRRLEAFKQEALPVNGKLRPVEIVGKGRVLIDIPSADNHRPSPEPTTGRKRGQAAAGGRGKKKRGADGTSHYPASGSAEDYEKPNWPDAEFPWRLRVEERVELARAEEEERLRCIERFLDRDSDDEDQAAESNEPVNQYDYGSLNPTPHRHRSSGGKLSSVVIMPSVDGHGYPLRPASDPGDALTALLAKKRVRTLSYRQRKRQRSGTNDDDDDETVCICQGKDDGRELVQCDACQTWYHLHCIGIRSISELGREEDPWFCRRCVRLSRSPSPSVDSDISLLEPTFAPTDDSLLGSSRRGREGDQFWVNHSAVMPESPHPHWSNARAPPRTPPRRGGREYPQTWHGGHHGGHDHPSSAYTRYHPSAGVSSPLQHTYQPTSATRHGAYAPSTPTPRDREREAERGRPSTGDPYRVIRYEESPFDPTSTPSRGIRFGNGTSSSGGNPAFATPTQPQSLRPTQSWPRPPNSVYQTPSRSNGMSHGRSGSGSGTGSSLSGGSAMFHHESGSTAATTPFSNSRSSMLPYGYGVDESPIRRNGTGSSTGKRGGAGGHVSSSSASTTPTPANPHGHGHGHGQGHGQGHGYAQEAQYAHDRERASSSRMPAHPYYHGYRVVDVDGF